MMINGEHLKQRETAGKETYTSSEGVRSFGSGGSCDASNGSEEHGREREESELGLHGYC